MVLKEKKNTFVDNNNFFDSSCWEQFRLRSALL